MDYSSIFSAILGGSIVVLVQFVLDRRKERYTSLKNLTEERYRSTLVFMKCSFDFTKKKYFHDPNPLSSEKEYLEKVIEYYYHGLLYLPDDVLLRMKEFIKTPNQSNFIRVAKSMRKDLWGMRTKLSERDILLDEI